MNLLSIRWLGALTLALTSCATQAAGYLWKVEGGTAPLYLVGSIHVMPPKTYPLDSKFEQAYAESKQLVFETDLDAAQKPETIQAMIAAGTYDDGGSAATRWSETLRSDFADAAAEIHLPVEIFSRARPWFAALALQMNVFQREGFEPENGIDQYFYRQAKKDQKAIVTLESTKAQMSLFTDMPDTQSERFLLAMIAQLEAVDFSAADYFTLWKEEDVGELEDQLDDMHDDQPDIYNRVIAQRNRAWLSPIVQMLLDGRSAMVVVGALHLPGPDGLISALKKAGYKVKRIRH